MLSWDLHLWAAFPLELVAMPSPQRRGVMGEDGGSNQKKLGINLFIQPGSFPVVLTGGFPALRPRC